MTRSAAHWPWVLGALLIAIVVHLLSLYAIPHLVMSRAIATMAQGGGFNRVAHAERATATSHGVVRPSPDLLYSACPFDLSSGPLLVRAHVPAGTYWSVSAFDAETDNFFVRNDLQVPGGELGLLIEPPNARRTTAPKSLTPIVSPTLRGLVLFRTLINDEANFAELDAARRQTSCQTYRPEN